MRLLSAAFKQSARRDHPPPQKKKKPFYHHHHHHQTPVGIAPRSPPRAARPRRGFCSLRSPVRCEEAAILFTCVFLFNPVWAGL